MVLEDGLTVGGKPLRDYLEAQGHGDAYEYMVSLAGGRDITEAEGLIPVVSYSYEIYLKEKK